MGLKKPTDTGGYELRDDPLGRKIWHVEEPFADGDGEPKYVRARVGPFGLGKSVLIPIRVAAVDGDAVLR